MIDAMGLADPALAEQRVASVFERIHREQMAGLPLLNSALTVATIGFQSFRSRVIGIVSTPWMMSLMMLPGVDDQWQSLGLGEKQSHDFPAGTYRFLVKHTGRPGCLSDAFGILTDARFSESGIGGRGGPGFPGAADGARARCRWRSAGR